MRDGEPSPVTGGVNPTTGRQYDRGGHPNFDGVTYGAVDLPVAVIKGRVTKTHMRHASKALWDQIKDNPQMKGRFDKDQRDALAAGEPHIPRATCDHDPKTGRMVLMDRDPHRDNAHIGHTGKTKDGGR